MSELPKPPPPSPVLRVLVNGAQPVRLRRPRRVFAIIIGAAMIYLALWLTQMPRRRDLPYLPFAWWALLALAWLGAFVVPLRLALVPPRGSVLPDGARASSVALAATMTLLLLAFALTPAVPPYTIIPVGAAATAHSIRHCLTLGLAIALGPLAVGLLALRPLLLVGGARLMGAVGAAAGALGGLALHVVCPLGGPLHVGLGHAGSVVVAALLGALVGRLVDR